MKAILCFLFVFLAFATGMTVYEFDQGQTQDYCVVQSDLEVVVYAPVKEEKKYERVNALPPYTNLPKSNQAIIYYHNKAPGYNLRQNS